MIITSDKKIIDYEYFLFPSGEPHIRVQWEYKPVNISVDLYSSNELIKLLLACDSLKRQGCSLETLSIGYFAGGRQDRVANKGEALTVKVYADIVNSIGFMLVNIIDPHSDVTTALVKNATAISPFKPIQDWIYSLGLDEYLLISPDMGANKKTQSLCKYLGKNIFVSCSKERDTMTGKLKSFNVYADDLHGKPCVIVDDICDGGGTFLGLANELKKKNAGELYLYVTHGIFSKGKQELEKVFINVSSLNQKP